MSCHARRCRVCVLSKCGDVMPCSTLTAVCVVQGRGCHATPDVTDRVCCPRAVMSCHAQHYRLCVLSKGSDVMPHPMLPYMCVVLGQRYHSTPDITDRVCCPWAVMSCNARRCQPCVLSKGDDVMPHPTSSNRGCIPRVVISSPAQHCTTVCAFQRR